MYAILALEKQKSETEKVSITKSYDIRTKNLETSTLVSAYLITHSPMRSPKEIREAEKELTPKEREKLLGKLVSSKVQRILDRETLKAVAASQKRVSLVLKASECTDPDQKIADFLRGHGYSEVHVTSDFPGYCESYVGTTKIQFSIPE